jgi:predicted PurR-regulated permease PerM
MQIKQSTFIWVSLFLLFSFMVYLVNDVLMPFVFAGVVAYFLDPLADKIENAGLSRTNATIISLSIFGVVFFSLLFFLGPILVHQFGKLSANLPEYFSELETKHSGKVKEFISQYAPGLEGKIKDFGYEFSVQVVQKTGDIIRGLVTSASAVANFIAMILISPVVAFYLVRDWDIVVKKVDDLIPRHKLVAVRHEFSKIDSIISAYIRGQFNVCLIMALFYSVNLTFAGLDYGIAIGMLTGLLTFIPYVGFTIGMIVGLLVAYFQFGFADGLVLTLLAFIFGQVLENYVAPKLIGDKVQLHPTWIIFALLVGGNLLGFTGVLIAIPTAAVMGVLVRTSITKYKKSNLYLGYPLVSIKNPSDADIDIETEAEYMPAGGINRNTKSHTETVEEPEPLNTNSHSSDSKSSVDNKRRGRPKKVL